MVVIEPSLAKASLVLALLATQPVAADEGGVSFWLPGQFGSLASAPGAPGWSMPVLYYHGDISAGGERAFPVGNRIVAGMDAQIDAFVVNPMYTVPTPVAGGQLSVGFAVPFGRVDVSATATLTGPGGGTLTGSIRDTYDGAGDFYPLAALKWNRGTHNYMLYALGGIPTGTYDPDRLANLSLGHAALDVGGGYTFFNPASGHEFSAALGFTFNGENHDTDYRNGNSAHLDWAASQFLSETFHIGIAGYFYQQLEGDSGDGAVLGDFKSRVSGIGPQAGWMIPAKGRTWYLNLRGYHEFDARNRPEGWNAWLTLLIPLSAPPPAS